MRRASATDSPRARTTRRVQGGATGFNGAGGNTVTRVDLGATFGKRRFPLGQERLWRLAPGHRLTLSHEN